MLYLNYEAELPLGGGAETDPLWFFVDSGKTAARSAAVFCIALRATILHILPKEKRCRSDQSMASDVRVTSCFAIFVQKQRFAEMAVKLTVLKLK